MVDISFLGTLYPRAPSLAYGDSPCEIHPCTLDGLACIVTGISSVKSLLNLYRAELVMSNKREEIRKGRKKYRQAN